MKYFLSVASVFGIINSIQALINDDSNAALGWFVVGILLFSNALREFYDEKKESEA